MLQLVKMPGFHYCFPPTLRQHQGPVAVAVEIAVEVAVVARPDITYSVQCIGAQTE